MNLQPGAQLGPYEIVSRIGAGGMGEVWKARDTRLDRSVAVKVLSAEFAASPQIRTRFEREARTISQLEHPNICRLYDVGDDYLVMELLDGESLADRLAKGPLPLDDVLKYGAQIAEALDRAHGAGVVHRDLKPGNIMLTKSGAKLLDFGLAKSAVIEVSTEGATVQKPLTQEGTILGTFQYMAPEQLEGEEADPRTDIFALGAVLYEMATGRRAFEGKTKTSLIAAIVGGSPRPIGDLQPLTPSALEHVIAKCLAKDRESRWQSARDIAEELKWIREVHEKPAQVAERGKSAGWAAAAVVAAAAAAVIAFLLLRPRAEPHLVLSFPPPHAAGVDEYGLVTLSPDGQTAAFVARRGTQRSLWVRSIPSGEERELPGTNDALIPFFSPDGASIGFFAEGKLKRIPTAGGPAQVVCDAAVPQGGTWSSKGVILFTRDGLGPIYRVNASGGTPQAVTRVGPREEAHRWPYFLPDGEHFLFLGDAARTEDHHIKLGSLRGESRDLMQAITNPMYVEPGYILFVRGGSLLAQRFDVKQLVLEGDPVVLGEQVAADGMNHHYDFTASNSGSLAYRSVSPASRFAWVDRSGRLLQTLSDPRAVGFFLLSPNQRSLAFESIDADGRNDDLWILDLARGVTSRLTVNPAADVSPQWSPDGTSIAYSSMTSGLGDPFILRVGNPSSPVQLLKSPLGAYPTNWSRSGEFIALDYMQPSGGDVWIYSTRTKQAAPYLTSRFEERSAAFSPDTSMIAYTSNESGQWEIYVEQFPSHENRRQLSHNGGDFARWRADGKELYYVTPSHVLAAVDPKSDVAQPQELFVLRGGSYDASADGQRFLVVEPVDDVTRVPMTFVTNWTAALKK